MNLIQLGGPWAMIPLCAAGVFGFAIFLNRFFHLHRAHIHAQDFVDGIMNVVKKGNLAEAITLCEDTPGPVARIVRVALLRMDDTPAVIAQAVRKAGLEEIPRLEHRLGMLATLTRLAPMLGLFGAVVGLIELLLALERAAPLAHAGDLGQGMMRALLASAVGLGLGILGQAAYHFLVGRVEQLCLQMEHASVEIFTQLARRRQARAEPGAAP
jgi:biopolymer transport protein ExbB